MARRTLGPASLRVVQAVQHCWPDAPGDGTPVRVRLGVSGGADSMALAAGVAHVLSRRATGPGSLGVDLDAVVVDHGLFPGSAEHSLAVVGRLRALGLDASMARVAVDDGGSLEDAARRARHDALWNHVAGDRPAPREVWLAHTLDDQAETVLLGLARGSGTRSLAGMAARRPHSVTAPGNPDAQAPAHRAGEVVRPLLALRRRDTEQACAEWGIEVWHDPANRDPRFRRSALRAGLARISDALGADLAPNLARTALLARADADLLDELADEASGRAAVGGDLDAEVLASLPMALRSRVVHRWLSRCSGTPASHSAVLAVLDLVDDWHGQGPLHLAGGTTVQRRGPMLVVAARPPARTGTQPASPAGERAGTRMWMADGSGTAPQGADPVPSEGESR